MNAKEVRLTYGEVRLIENNWSGECEERNTTLVTSTWEANAAPLTGQAITGNITSVRLTAPPTAWDQLTNTVTLANGETIIALRDIWTL